MFYPPLLMIFMLIFLVLAIFLFAFLQVGGQYGQYSHCPTGK